MPEKMSEVYEMYDMEVLGMVRGRGAIILKTDKGIRQVCPMTGADRRLAFEKEFKEKLYNAGFVHIDRCVENTDGELITCDRYGNPYVVREYFEGRECQAGNTRDLTEGAGNLAELHVKCREIYEQEKGKNTIKLPGNFHGKNQELKKIRAFVSKRPDKNEFELLYIKAFDYFYLQAKKCEEMLKEEQVFYTEKNRGYCHGTYNYHSILFCDGYIATTNFERFHPGCQLMDLYQYIRKVMEKNSYNFELVVKILSEYGRIIPLNQEDYSFIYMMYRYPEKFWKVSNRYMNSRKSWLSPVNMEKLQRVISDEQEKIKILREFSSYYGVHKNDF